MQDCQPSLVLPGMFRSAVCSPPAAFPNLPACLPACRLQWGKMEAASGHSFTPKADFNLSLVEYELVPVRQEAGGGGGVHAYCSTPCVPVAAQPSAQQRRCGVVCELPHASIHRGPPPALTSPCCPPAPLQVPQPAAPAEPAEEAVPAAAAEEAAAASGDAAEPAANGGEGFEEAEAPTGVSAATS